MKTHFFPRSILSKKFCALHLLKYAIVSSTALAFLVFLITHFRVFPKHAVRGNTFSAFAKRPFRQNSSRTASDERFPLVREFELRSHKKFDNEEARLIGFSEEDVLGEDSERPAKIIYLATTYFGEWNPKHYYFLHEGDATFTRYPCEVDRCYVTNRPSDLSRSAAVLFHVRDLEIFHVPPVRPPGQVWILYSMEPPWLEIRDMRRFNGVFNWTMSYRKGSDLVVPYGFVGERPNPGTLSRQKLDNLFREKSDKAVWYVSNCNTDSRREDYVARLRKVYPVDVVGGCGTEACRPAESKHCYTKLVRTYKFYLAFENALCRNYVTEKLFNPLAYSIIPVTFGGANYSAIVPPNSIINAMEFASPEELGDYLWQVSINQSLYLSYFEWKQNYRSYLQPWMCDLCRKLHEPVTSRTIHDLETWWNEGDSCRRWTSDGLVPIQNHPFPEYHTHKLQ